MINMRGLKLREAIQLVAEEILTESEMATRLNVSVGSLLKLNKDPIFTRRVRQERAALARERSSKKWSPGVLVNTTPFVARSDPNGAARA